MLEIEPFPLVIYPLLRVEKTYQGYSAQVEGIHGSLAQGFKYKQEAIDQAIILARKHLELELATKGFPKV